MTASARPSAILTFDMEFWYNSEFLRTTLARLPLTEMADRVEEQLATLLPALRSANATATFFILGTLAERFPTLIRRIADAGHEIASHGYSHTPLTRLTPEAFRDELRKTNAIFADITGNRPMGFRAPAFSLTPASSWAIAVLQEEGFTYDASIFPSGITPHGSSRAPLKPYRIAADDLYTESTSPHALIELPVAVYPFLGIRIPLGGGIYFRALPGPLLSPMLRSVARTQAPMLYFHTHEFDVEIPSILRPVRSWKTAIKYVGTAGSWGKFQRLLTSYQAVSIASFLQHHALRS